jgi:hypothetical protein
MGRGLSNLQKTLLKQAKASGDEGIRPCIVAAKRFDKLPKKQRDKRRRLLMSVIVGKALRRLKRRGLLTEYGNEYYGKGNHAYPYTVRYWYARLLEGDIPLDS